MDITFKTAQYNSSDSKETERIICHYFIGFLFFFARMTMEDLILQLFPFSVSLIDVRLEYITDYTPRD